ncbi:MAG: TlpA family protein disulfide reductase [Bacteroidales bacterium]|nr:TlpA family protein disulfide reductase [Bacteroidales bacterium]
MKFFPGLILLLLIYATTSLGQQTVLTGTAKQFADEHLIIRTVTNPVTGGSVVLDSLFITKNGDFRIELSQKESRWIFINSGIFRVSMFIRPGIGYEIELPPKTIKSEADIRNPFFAPVFTHIRVLHEFPLDHPQALSDEYNLNALIFTFDTTIASANNKIRNARREHRELDADSLIRVIEERYLNDTSVYFRDYRKYRYGVIRINSRNVGLQYIYNHYLKSENPHPDNPAWFELFSEMYREFLFYYSRTEDGRHINYLVNRKQDVEALKDTLMKHPAIPDKKLAELIIIKECFDIYFKDYFYREALIMMLDTIIQDPEVIEHKFFAKEVKEYLTRLKTGQKPPDFYLPDQENIYRTIDDFNGKYVYLNFCTPDNYSCLKEFPFLKALSDRHEKYLSVVTVMVTKEHHEMTDFMSKNGYNWTALFYENNDELLHDYAVKAFPTSYLIDPNGLLIQSPATLATEGLEQQLFQIMRSRGDL